MTQAQFPTTQELPESLCAVGQALQASVLQLSEAEHVPHIIYAGNTGIRIGRCSGIGTFQAVVTPAADPFALIPGADDDSETW